MQTFVAIVGLQTLCVVIRGVEYSVPLLLLLYFPVTCPRKPVVYPIVVLIFPGIHEFKFFNLLCCLGLNDLLKTLVKFLIDIQLAQYGGARSEERRVGKECIC